MGLAASQARLLTITSRKADCEFLSMNLSHQKLSLARDMENISSEYQNALNTTKLVFDYYGSGDKNMDLSYGLMMTPTIYNDYSPKLVTDTKNRVILNSAYAKAARDAGIPIEGLKGLPSSNVRNRFIEALAGANIISPTTAASIEAVTYNNALGLGETIYATTSVSQMSFNELMNLLKANKSLNSMNNAGLEDQIFTGEGLIYSAGNWKHNANAARLGWSNGRDFSTYEEIYADSTTKQTEALNKINEITLSDLLSGDTQYYIGASSRSGELLPSQGLLVMQHALIGSGEEGTSSFLNWLQNAFTELLGGSTISQTAITYAYDSLYNLLYPSQAFDDYTASNIDGMDHKKSGKVCDWYDHNAVDVKNYINDFATRTTFANGTDDGKYYPIVTYDSQNYIGFTYTEEYDDSGASDDTDKSQCQINLNNLAKVFLTAYVQFMQGIENSPYKWDLGRVDNTDKVNLYNPSKDDFMFDVVTETQIEDGDSKLDASFYDTLFNQICLNGWSENEKIDDKDYLTNLLKNGMAFVSTISDDGMYYQGNYSTERTILEVTDEDAIAKAQAKYNTEKAKIESKENTIDMKLKNLDTEISALTTEYDTTKQVITKAIEKSFKRYEA